MGRRARAPVVGRELECKRGVKSGRGLLILEPSHYQAMPYWWGYCEDYGHGIV